MITDTVTINTPITRAPADAPRCGTGEECPSCPFERDSKNEGRLEALLDDFGPESDCLPVIYLSGPMSGIKDYNFPRFNETARRLRALGFPVLNPADFGASESHSWEDCISRDLSVIAFANVILLLPGWEESKGANLELDVAVGLNKSVVTMECFIAKVAEPLLGRHTATALVKLDNAREALAVVLFEPDDEDGEPNIVVADREQIEEWGRLLDMLRPE